MKLYFSTIKDSSPGMRSTKVWGKVNDKEVCAFLPTTESFTLEDFPYYWITQVHAQYVQNIDNALKNMV